MLNTLRIYNELKETMDSAAAEKIAEVIGLVYDELRNSVTKTEFNELKEIVRGLGEAQQRTEQRMEELAAAQQRTEQRMEELAAAQQRTEQRMEELAAAQQRTEQRVEELAVAQQRTEQRMEELAVAQQRTERAVQSLARQVGGLSDTIGGDLEDIAYIVLHDVLRREFGWQVGVLQRVWQTWDTEPEEVNVFGQATDPTRPDATIWIVGEAKHNLTAKEVNRFVKQLARARKRLTGEIFPVCFCYRARPEVQEMLKEPGIHLVFSYGRLVRA